MEDDFICTEASQIDLGKVTTRIKKEKETKKLTTQDLSDMTGLSISTINKILSGATSTPTASSIAALCCVLGISMDELYGLPTHWHEQEYIEDMRQSIRDKTDEIKSLNSQIDMLTQVLHAEQKVEQQLQAEVYSRRPMLYILFAACFLLSMGGIYTDWHGNIKGQLSALGWGMVAFLVLGIIVVIVCIVAATKLVVKKR